MLGTRFLKAGKGVATLPPIIGTAVVWWLGIGLDVGFWIELFQADDFVFQDLYPSLKPGNQFLLLDYVFKQAGG